jgi:uncharacterized cupin superfamily protein
MAKNVKKTKRAATEAGPKSVAKATDQSAEAHILRAKEIGKRQQTFSHPWNPNSELIGVELAKQLGLRRVGVSIMRVPPGKESDAPHANHRAEEWLYILMGEGLALIGNAEVPVGAGDFIAFPAPQVVHQLKNAGQDDLVYLTGGENTKMDIVDFPTLGKRLVRAGGEVTAYPMEAGDVLSAGKSKKPKKPKS